jgi:chromosome segregation ATPase
MELPDLQRIPEIARKALGTVVAATAVDQIVGFLRETAHSLQQLAHVTERVDRLEEQAREHGRELRERQGEVADRLAKAEAQVQVHARELSELRVRLHGSSARVARLEEETGHQIREVNQLRARVDASDQQAPQVDLAEVQRHLAANEERITAALAEVRRHLSSGEVRPQRPGDAARGPVSGQAQPVARPQGNHEPGTP